ncbi:MAG TPA: transglycosylase family protein [Candidatus Eisenbacteria bacterium]|nr:transglycosylase family protein [Candidatus Eisenbacteria bacterium]
MERVGRIYIAGFVSALILIPVVLGLFRNTPAVLSAQIHISPTPTHSTSSGSSTPTSTPTPTPSPTSTPTPIPTATPTPSPSPTPIPTANPQNDAVWEQLAQCESHANWAADTGNGYYGGLQFNQSAWESVGGTGKPSVASRDEQIAKGKLLQAARGWSPWGACSKQLGLQ